MEHALLCVLTIISLLLSYTHISFVFLLCLKKLKLRDLFIWLFATLLSIFITIFQLFYQVSNSIIPIFPIFGIVGLILLAISLIILIGKKRKH